MQKRTCKRVWGMILRGIGLFVLLLLVLFFAVRAIGVKINQKVPENGINEECYVQINGTKQWISIYGQDRDNPVLLVLHGGPGASQSAYAYAYQKAWAENYTVVSWDQRGCGLSADESLQGKDITFDVMLSDAVQMVGYIRDNLDVDKLTLLGYSWGTMLGARLVYEYPQYFDAFLAAGQVVNTYENEAEFVSSAKTWAKDDPEGLALVRQLTPEHLDERYYALKAEILSRYGHASHFAGYGFNYEQALYFNPYYSLTDLYRYLTTGSGGLYADFVRSEQYDNFSVADQTQYQVPYYFICGQEDYLTNYNLAQKYYEQIQAPRKEYFLIPDCTHGLMEEKTEAFTNVLMKIAAMQRESA